MITALAIGLGLGLLLGAVGGGGAILAVPVLVYVLGEGLHAATTGSLAVVAVGAAVGAAGHARAGRVCWRVALAFTATAVPAGVAGTLAARAVGGRVLLSGFAVLMLAAAFATWRRAGGRAASGSATCPPVHHLAVAAAGAAVGLVTGFFGVGGGFVVVPVLTLALGMGMRRATATSLVVVALVSTSGLASHLAAGSRPDWHVVVPFAAAVAAGAWSGGGLAVRVPQRALAGAFSVMMALLATSMLVANLA